MARDAQKDGSARTETARHTVSITTRELGTREGHETWSNTLDSVYCE